MKIIKILMILVFCSVGSVMADNRINITRTVFRSGTSTLVKRGDARIYSLTFIATASNGNFIVLDSLTDTTVTTGSITDIRAEGGVATSGSTYVRDFSNHELELSTGLYIVVNNGYLTVAYD